MEDISEYKRAYDTVVKDFAHQYHIPVFDAIKRGDINRVEYSLRIGMDPNTLSFFYYAMCYNQYDIVLELLSYGGIIPEKSVQHVWTEVITYQYEPLINLIMTQYDVVVTDKILSTIITSPRIYNVKSNDKPRSKKSILHIIDYMLTGSTMLTGKRYLHDAVKMGDYDILCALLEHPFIRSTIDEKDDNGDTPVQLSMKQGLVLQTFLLLQVSVSQRAQLTYTDARMNRAHHAFYTHILREIERCVLSLDPTKDTEPIMSMAQRLLLDVSHPSGIGFPDNVDYKAIMKLENEQDIERTITEWSETNPLAAMRWHYVYRYEQSIASQSIFECLLDIETNF